MHIDRWLLLGLLVIASIVGGVFYLRLHSAGPSLRSARRQARVGCAAARKAFHDRDTGAWLTVSGKIIQLLPDEYGSLQHQRFIVRCASGLTVLIVNDVSIGTRVPVADGDMVAVHGLYVWNSQGGLVHFTHRAEGGGAGGWILFRDHIYSQLTHVRSVHPSVSLAPAERG